jgi:hypothetical protein
LRLIALSFAAVVALAACTEQAPESTAADGRAPTPAPAEPRPAPSPVVGDSASQAPADECGAEERQDWIGRPRSDLPSPPQDALWRVYETGQPVTQDLRRNRLNIEIDPKRQTVVHLSCG